MGVPQEPPEDGNLCLVPTHDKFRLGEKPRGVSLGDGPLSRGAMMVDACYTRLALEHFLQKGGPDHQSTQVILSILYNGGKQV